MFNIGDSAVFQYAGNGGYWSVQIQGFSQTGNYAVVLIDGIVVPPPNLCRFDPITQELAYKRVYNIAIAELLPRQKEADDDNVRAAFNLAYPIKELL